LADICTASSDVDAGAGLQQALCHHSADAARPAGYERDLVLEIEEALEIQSID
jgi:hypothetical protein